MIENSPENRRIITDYLESINEDTFIDEFIIPFYSAHGYYLYRKNSHGPGEGGKDIIFYRNVPFFFDNEYLAIQAKAQTIAISNVVEITHQLTRALYLPFPAKSGIGNTRANYAILINSKRINNEANDTLISFISNNPNVKVLAQENVCELIIKSGIAPKSLLSSLSQYAEANDNSSENDKYVLKTLLCNDPNEINSLFNTGLQVLKTMISENVKGVVIEYIFNYWDNDPTWSGTVKPMKWLDKYFELIQPVQYPKLMKIFYELTSSTPSFQARNDTYSVSQKITCQMIKEFLDEFIKYCCVLSWDKSINYRHVLLNLLNRLKEQDEIPYEFQDICNDILRLFQNGISPETAQEYERVSRYYFDNM